MLKYFSGPQLSTQKYDYQNFNWKIILKPLDLIHQLVNYFLLREGVSKTSMGALFFRSSISWGLGYFQ